MLCIFRYKTKILLFLAYLMFLAIFISADSYESYRSYLIPEQVSFNYDQNFWIKNIGQLPKNIKYYTNIHYGRMYITDEGIVFQTIAPYISSDTNASVEIDNFHDLKINNNLSDIFCIRNIYITFQGACYDDIIEKASHITKLNFFKGKERDGWITDVPTYSALRVKNVFYNVDLVFDFLDSDRFWYIEAAEISDIYSLDVMVDIDNEFGCDTLFGAAEPDLFLEIFYPGVVIENAFIGNFNIFDCQIVEIRKSSYINPTCNISTPQEVIWGTYIGGAQGEIASSLFLDSNDNVYITGYTNSYDIPVPSGFSQTYASSYDIYVAKLHPSGDQLLWATLIGGSMNDTSSGISLDSDNNVLIAGTVMSDNIPVPGGFDFEFNGGHDIYVAKLNSDGNQMLWGTYIGGESTDYCKSMVIDSNDNIILGGYTRSYLIPTPNGYDQEKNGANDIYIAKLRSSGDQLLWATYIGGSFSDESIWDGGGDYCSAIALDSSENIIIGGYTLSDDIPTPNGFDQTYNGYLYWHSFDKYVAKLSADGSQLIWGTYIGGSFNDVIYSIATDMEDNVVLVGYTESHNIPTPNGYCQEIPEYFGIIIYVARLSASGNQLHWGTYIDRGIATCVAVANDNNIYLGADTQYSNMPTPHGFDQTYNGGANDMYITKLSSMGSLLLWGTYLGGIRTDRINDIALDSYGNITLCGVTGSYDIPTPNGYDQTFNSVSSNLPDIYVAKISDIELEGPDAALLPGSVCLNPQNPLPGDNISITAEINNLGDISIIGGLAEFYYRILDSEDYNILISIDSVEFGTILHYESEIIEVMWDTSNLDTGFYNIVVILTDIEPYDIVPDNNVSVYEVILPVKLDSFAAIGLHNYVEIQWMTTSEIENLSWNIYRLLGKKVSPFLSFIPIKLNVSSIPGHGGFNMPAEYSFNDSVKPQGNYFYILEVINDYGDPIEWRTKLIWALEP